MKPAPRFGREFVQHPTDGPTVIGRERYTDPVRFDREVDEVFSSSWLRAFPATEVASPRTFRVWERFGQTVAVTRQDDETLRAFHNVCQHRGARIVRDTGSCPSGKFVCPWHGFTYDLTGRVISVPRSETFKAELLDGLRAPEVAVTEWAGFVWVNLRGNKAEPLASYLGEIKGELDWYGLESWKVWGHKTWEVAANWKVVQEGFLEAWHVPFSHSSSLSGAGVDRKVTFQQLGRHNMMVMRRRGQTRHDPEPVGDHRAVAIPHYLAFPNALWNCEPILVTAQAAWPVAVDHTLLEVWSLAPPTQPEPGRTQAEWEKFMDRVLHTTERVIGEDAFVAGEAGATARSRGYTANRLNSQEHRISSFHATLDACLAESDAERGADV